MRLRGHRHRHRGGRVTSITDHVAIEDLPTIDVCLRCLRYAKAPVTVTVTPRRVTVAPARATSVGSSPMLKQAIALASVPTAFDRPGARVDVEWSVEGRRGRVKATVVGLPFLDLERKRA